MKNPFDFTNASHMIILQGDEIQTLDLTSCDVFICDQKNKNRFILK